MKGKNIILVGAGAIIGALALKVSFDFGAKMGVSLILSELPSEDISKIVPKEKGGWNKDILRLLEIIKEEKTK